MKLSKLDIRKKEMLKTAFTLFLICTIVTGSTFCAYFYMDRGSFYDGVSLYIWIYHVASALGYASIWSVILVSIFFIIPSLLLKKSKIPLVIYTIFAITLQTLAIINSYVLTLYKYHISFDTIKMFFEGGSKVFVIDDKTIVSTIINIIIFAIVPYIVTSLFAKRISYRIHKKLVSYSLAFLFSCNVILYGVFCYAIINRGHSNTADNIILANEKLPHFISLGSNRLLSKIIIENYDEVDRIIFDFRVEHQNDKMKYPLAPIITNDSIPLYNIVYIALDSWTFKSYNEETAPNMYKFATQKGQYFANHTASAHCTNDGNYNLFYGLSAHYYDLSLQQKTSPIFIDRLLELNYNTSVLVSAGFDSWAPLDRVIFNKIKNIDNIDGNSAFERDNTTQKKAIQFIDKQSDKNPFFMYIFYDLLHAMSIPEEYRTKFTPSLGEAPYASLNNSMDPTEFYNLYKNCAYYLDSLVADVINEIDKKGLLDKTIIVITGDHGQEFNENKKNYWGHGSYYSDWQTRVPMIIYYPGIEAGKTYSHLTTHQDITPTIMKRFMGVENPMEDYSMGVELEDSTVSRYPLLYDGFMYRGGFGFENAIIWSEYRRGYSVITDKQLNKIPRSSIDIDLLKKGMDRMGRFYEKE